MKANPKVEWIKLGISQVTAMKLHGAELKWNEPRWKSEVYYFLAAYKIMLKKHSFDQYCNNGL